MWSGPRNLSTAMMYSFGARSDCAVWDEPFYAAYLLTTGLDHPMRDAIIKGGDTDPDRVSSACLGDIPGGKGVYFLKLMAQHMIPGFDRTWCRDCVNVFLIRHPARVIASYAAKRQNPTLDDIGFRQQAELFDAICQQNGAAPPVVDSLDIRANPEGTLAKLCKAIGLPFENEMLRWPKGGNPGDGIWADHWYGAVKQSTGFARPEGALPKVAAELQDVLAGAMPAFQLMQAHKIV